MPEALPNLGPQASLEQAVVELLRTQLGYRENECQREFDAQPPASCGDVYLAIWSDGSRESSQRNALDERMGVNVTLTLRLKVPEDRWLSVRDDVETRLNAVRALLHKDSWDQRVIRLANLRGGRSEAATRHMGFVEGLVFDRYEPLKLVPGSWFGASKGGDRAGVAQTARFREARILQSIATAR